MIYYSMLNRVANDPKELIVEFFEEDRSRLEKIEAQLEDFGNHHTEIRLNVYLASKPNSKILWLTFIGCECV